MILQLVGLCSFCCVWFNKSSISWLLFFAVSCFCIASLRMADLGQNVNAMQQFQMQVSISSSLLQSQSMHLFCYIKRKQLSAWKKEHTVGDLRAQKVQLLYLCKNMRKGEDQICEQCVSSRCNWWFVTVTSSYRNVFLQKHCSTGFKISKFCLEVGYNIIEKQNLHHSILQTPKSRELRSIFRTIPVYQSIMPGKHQIHQASGRSSFQTLSSGHGGPWFFHCHARSSTEQCGDQLHLPPATSSNV